MTIEEILAKAESQSFDRKSIQIDPKALAITIVAFANADGGDIAIGITDKTKKIEGIADYPEKINELLQVPFKFCKPSAKTTVQEITCTERKTRFF